MGRPVIAPNRHSIERRAYEKLLRLANVLTVDDRKEDENESRYSSLAACYYVALNLSGFRRLEEWNTNPPHLI